MRSEADPETYDDARKDLTRSLETKLRYDYNYLEHLSTSFLCCCCCFKKLSCYKRRMKTFQRYELALEQLTSEVDFFSFVKLLRLTDFMSKIHMKEYQRNLVPYFKRFQLTEIEGDKDKVVFDTALLGSAANNLIKGEDEEAMAMRIANLNLMEMVRDVSFVDNPVDLAILYEMTGY